jgi:hypothetical protein
MHSCQLLDGQFAAAAHNLSGYNLGSECLTSKKSKAAYREYLCSNPDFRKKTEDKIGDILGLDDEALQSASDIEAQAVADDDVSTEDLDLDDIDVPLHCVVKETLQLDSAKKWTDANPGP